MSEKTKKLKSTLVRTRKVIAKKFRQLHDQKDERKRRFNEKYEPITSTLQKLIDSKKNINKSTSEEIPLNRSHRQDTSESSIQTDSDDYDNFNDGGDNNEPDFDDDDDEMAFDDYQNYGNEASNKNNENVNDHNQNQADETVPIRQLLLENENLPGAMDLNDTAQTFTMDDVPMGAVTSKRMRNVVDDNVLGNEQKRGKKLNSNKKSQPKVTAVKKKWNELQYLKAVRRMALSKIKPVDARASQSMPKVAVSPEDYDEDGYYRGAEKPKRRRIVTSSLRYLMVQPRTGRKINKKRPIKKVADKQTVAGEGLEREFIPYTENIVYQYWDDPNELCDRLRLLLASKTAGNSNHEQEINSIIQELRDRNIIM